VIEEIGMAEVEAEIQRRDDAPATRCERTGLRCERPVRCRTQKISAPLVDSQGPRGFEADDIRVTPNVPGPRRRKTAGADAVEPRDYAEVRRNLIGILDPKNPFQQVLGRSLFDHLREGRIQIMLRESAPGHHCPRFTWDLLYKPVALVSRYHLQNLELLVGDSDHDALAVS
jgi:hypothetical protein